MSLYSKIRESITNRLSSYASREISEAYRQSRDQADFLQESLNRLELEIENAGYYRLTQLAEYQFNRKRLGDICKLAVQMAIKNPLTNRTINVQADYVFGRGVRIVAKDENVQSVIDEFMDYYGNRRSLTSHTAMLQRERDHMVYGNLFFALYTNTRTGRVNVRIIDPLDVQDIVRDPEDYQRELFIKRNYDDGNGGVRHIYHPAFGITQDMNLLNPWEYEKGETGDEGDILWDAPVYHMCFNRFGKEKFAIPEIYPQLDWALAYKRSLEDFASIIRAFARMALKITGLSGKKQAAAAKGMLNTSTSLTNPIEKNPSAAAASIGLFGKGVDVEPVKTAGATTSPKEFSPLLNMSAAGAGLPNTFFGDASIGNYATAQTLDRPTELKMISRQELWKETYTDIIGYVLLHAAQQGGLLSEVGFSVVKASDPFTNDPIQLIQVPSDVDASFEVAFPDILERNVTDRVRALVNAVTLFGKQLTDIIPDKKLVARLLMEALNIPDIEKRIPDFVKMWEKNMSVEDGKPVEATIIPPPPPPTKGGFGAEDPSQGGDVGANG